MKTNRQPGTTSGTAMASHGVFAGWAAAALNTLASVKFAVAVIGAIVFACLIGTILPQGPDAAAFLEGHPAAADRMALFARLGLTHIFSALCFIALLCVLAATVMVCSTRRFLTVRRTSGSARRRAVGSMLTHISILLILAGAVVRGIWGEKGYIQLREGQMLAKFESQNGTRMLPFTLRLNKFEVVPDALPQTSEKSPMLLVQWVEQGIEAKMPANIGEVQTLTPKGVAPAPENSFRVEVLKYVPDFAVDTATREVTSRSSAPKNPAILVAVNGPDYQNHRWVFANFPDFTIHEGPAAQKPNPLRFVYMAGSAAQSGTSIKNFRSTLTVYQRGAASTQTLEVNRPLKLAGYTLYQTGYNPDDLTWTSMQVVRDPSVPFVYAGFALLIGGLTIVFYLNPWLSTRKAKA